MNIVFFGSDDFADRHLKELLSSGHSVVGCVAPPDRPKGRGMAMHKSLVKVTAEQAGIDVFQPKTLKTAEASDKLAKYNADIFVVIAYGRLLPQNILDIPPKGAVNVHGSLLPKYRGAAPINWALINGDDVTGVSIIQMNAAMDAGDVLSSSEVMIDPNDTSVTLRQKMMDAGADLLISTLADVEAGTAEAAVQDEASVTMAPKLTKQLGRIDWSNPARQIINLVRGLKPWPSAYTEFNGKQLKVLECASAGNSQDAAPGEVTEVRPDGFIVQTGQGTVLVTRVHLADARPMSATDFLRGHALQPGHKFI